MKGIRFQTARTLTVNVSVLRFEFLLSIVSEVLLNPESQVT